MKFYAAQSNTLDSMCWRYSRRTAVVVEKIYTLNNVIAVEIPNIAGQPLQGTLKLWD